MLEHCVQSLYGKFCAGTTVFTYFKKYIFTEKHSYYKSNLWN